MIYHFTDHGRDLEYGPRAVSSDTLSSPAQQQCPRDIEVTADSGTGLAQVVYKLPSTHGYIEMNSFYPVGRYPISIPLPKGRKCVFTIIVDGKRHVSVKSIMDDQTVY